MFADNIIDGSYVPSEVSHGGPFVSKIKPEALFRKEYFVVPISQNLHNSNGNTMFYCHVEYVNDVNEKIRNAYQLTITDNTHASANIKFGEIGKYKNCRWAFQQESRFRLLIFPFYPFLANPEDVSTIAINSIHHSFPVPFSEYFLKLNSEALDNIEITLHPNSSLSDRVIVETLCDKYAKKAIIKDSVLKGIVSLK